MFGGAFYVLVKLRVVEQVRKRLAGLFFFILPSLLLLLLGVIFWNGHPFEQHRITLVTTEEPAHAAVGETLARLPGVKVEPERSEPIARGRVRGRVVLAAVIAGVAGAPTRVLVARNDLVLVRGVAEALTEKLGRPALIEEIDVPRWGYVHYLFPGLLTFTILVAGLFGMGYHMVRYRNNQLLRKLATTPLSRASFIAAQIVGRMVVVMAQVVFLVAAARFVFDVPITAIGAAWLLVLTALGLLAFLGAGFLMACVFKNEATANDAINAVVMPLVLLSEIFFPADLLPGPLPHMASALPSTQMVRLIREVVLHGETHVGPLLPGLAILVVWIALTYTASLAAFRWND